MRYEAVWLFIVLGLLLETSLVFVSLWTLLFPVVSLLLLVASLAVKGRTPRRIAGGVSEGVSGVFAALYLLMVLGFVVATESDAIIAAVKARAAEARITA